jgi:hypothetical protein
MVFASPHLQPPQLWATHTKQREFVVGVTQEGDDDEIDGVAGDEG